MSQVTNVFRRGVTFYFRTRVPERFKAALKRRELWKSLRTADRSAARSRAAMTALLTEALWRDLERLMTSSRNLPDLDHVEALIDRWLKAELDEDDYIRSMPSSMIHAGVILRRRPAGFVDTIVRYLDDHEAAALEALAPKERAKQFGQNDYYLTQIEDQALRRAAHRQLFEGADRRHMAGDESIAEQDVAAMFAKEGLQVDPFSEVFEQASSLMLRAHRDVHGAISSRDVAGWRPRLDDDPAADLVTRTKSRLAAQPLAPLAPKLAGRAAMRLGDAAREAIPEIARTEQFKPKRVKDYENAVASFIAWRGHDPMLGDLTQQDAGSYNVALGRYPTNWKKRREYRDLLTFEDRRAKSVELGDVEILSAVTINTKYLAPLRAIYEWQRTAGSGLTDPFAGISSRKPRRTDPKDERRDFSIAELQRLFALPMFTGSKGSKHEPLYKPGPVRISDHRFWIPLICIFSGLRLNEACGLAVADLKAEGGIVYMHVRDEMEGQSVKAAASRRKVPLHHELIALGFPEFVERMRASGADRIFPELTLSASGYYSEAPSKFFAKVIERIVDPEPDDPGKLVFHSTRHTATSRLRAADVRKDVSEEIIGHESKDTHSGYGKVDIPTLKAAVDKIAYPGLDLSRLVFAPT